MRKPLIVALIVIAVVGGLGAAMRSHAPKPAPPSTQEIWGERGIPIRTAAVITGNMDQAIEVTGNITALDKVILSSKVAGRVAAVYAREGDSVRAGQVIIMLDQDDAQRSVDSAEEGLQSAIARLSQARTTAKVTKIQTDAAIEQAQSSLRSAQARLAVAKNPARSQEKTVAENRVAAAKASLDNKEADYKRHKMLLDKGAISQSTFDVVKTQYTIAQTDYKSAQQQFALILEGGRSEDVTAAKASVEMAEEQLRTAKANAAQNMLRAEDVRSAVAAVNQAQTALALARQQLSYTYIKAPFSGQLSSRTTEPGQVVSPGQALAEVVNPGSVYFKGDVSEKEVVNVAPGQPVKVRVDAISGKDFIGTVAEVFPSGSEQSRNFTVRIAINDKSPAIKPGMFARGDVVTSVHNDVLLIPKEAVDQRGGTSMVFVIEKDLKAKPAKADKKGKTPEPAMIAKRLDVQIVAENRDFVEIATPNGIEVGDILATAGRQNLQDNAKVAPSK